MESTGLNTDPRETQASICTHLNATALVCVYATDQFVLFSVLIFQSVLISDVQYFPYGVIRKCLGKDGEIWN